MNRKTYELPHLEIIEFEVEDVIAASSGSSGSGSSSSGGSTPGKELDPVDNTYGIPFGF